MPREQRSVHKTLDYFFGEKWIVNQLAKVKTSGYDDMNPMNLAKLRLHPVTQAIHDTQHKLAVSEARGYSDIVIGHSEALQSILHNNLTILEPLLDRKDINKRLTDINEFPKVEYELAIAAGYKRMGTQVKFIERTAAKRTGEFHVKNDVNNQVLVECKKKDLTSPKEKKISAWWEEFQHLMTQHLKKKNQFWGIQVDIPADADRQETHKLVSFIGELVSEEVEGESTLSQGKYKVLTEKFGPDGEPVSISDVDNFGNESDFGVVISNHKAKDVSSPLVYNPIKICAKVPSGLHNKKPESIIATLKDAYGQLDDELPNIIYVDVNVPSMKIEKLPGILQSIADMVAKKLGADLSKISAVVLTNIKLFAGYPGVGAYATEVVIYNTNARRPVPESFQIYGDKTTNHRILDDIKTLLP